MSYLYSGTSPAMTDPQTPPPRKHHAARNWRNRRKQPEQGIQTAPPPANPRAVGILLNSPEPEALRWVDHHRDNPGWLRLARTIETSRQPQRPAVLAAILAHLPPPSPQP